MGDESRAGVEQGEPVAFAATEVAGWQVQTPAEAAAAVSITIPLTLTLQLDSGAVAPGPQPVAPPARTLPARPAEPRRTPPAAFAGHPGYAPDFLGAAVPMPVIKASPRFGGPLAVPADRRSHPDDAHELRYPNYSVIMNAARRTAYVAAVNVDYAAPFREGRPRSEDWWLDGRIPDEAQLDNSYYEGNDYDRGHLAMRADCAWGMTRESAVRGNLASFHWTNCALQHKLFNQASGRRLWGDLENHIAAQGRGQRIRLSVFNGPAFAADDRPMRDAQVPAQFWKIVVWQDAADARPGAVGFVLDQSGLIQDMPSEAIDPGAFSIRQKAIADIDALLDLDLSGLAAFDRFRVTEGTEAAAGDPASVLIRSLDDMVL